MCHTERCQPKRTDKLKTEEQKPVNKNKDESKTFTKPEQNTLYSMQKEKKKQTKVKRFLLGINSI